jgi:integrin-linked kinase-associated serine/threonine phosphatase 2C
MNESGSYTSSFSAVNDESLCAMVVDSGVTSEQGHRKTMEDQHVIVSATRTPFFGVYDGHGGSHCAEFLRDHLHAYIMQHEELLTNAEMAIKEGIARAEREFLDKCRAEKIESGSTVALSLIINGTLYSGNVGDSEIVLNRGGVAKLLSTKHHLGSNPSEVERVKSVGGRIYHSRVGHPKFNPQIVSLAVSRAIGDAGFKLDEYTDGKASGIIADAETSAIPLQADDKFLIIGCDGLWDVMSHQAAVTFCESMLRDGSTSQQITEAIVAEALRLGSTDNVTVLFVNLHDPVAAATAPPPPAAAPSSA